MQLKKIKLQKHKGLLYTGTKPGKAQRSKKTKKVEGETKKWKKTMNTNQK
jgi:hypothetical protein